MIQVLGLRDFFDSKSGKVQRKETFFQKGWRFEKVEDVFDMEKRAEVLRCIPPEEHYNLYFTVADCFEEAGRRLREQWAIPFDIDDLDLTDALGNAEKAVRAAAEVLEVDFLDLGVVYTGNGVQFFIRLANPILSDDYFEETRDHYNLICKRIQNRLVERGIQGRVDNSVWTKARLMRLPDTENRKPGKENRRAVVMHSGMNSIDFDLVALSGLKEVEKEGHVPDQVLRSYPKPDTKAVCEGCKFLVYCKENQDKVSEPAWYAMVSLTSRLEDGRSLTHAYSEGHRHYNHYETENKIDQALSAAGPRTCQNIEGLWDGCPSCDYYGRVTSPIMIRGADYIASADFGYRERKVDKNGSVKPGRPEYIELVRTFEQEKPYKVIGENNLVFIFDGKKWIQEPVAFIKSWAMEKIRPQPSAAEMQEFYQILLSFNVVRQTWFNQASQDLVPFKNLVLNRRTGETSLHKPEHGLFFTLDFDYDPRATAPRWEKFIQEIAGDEEIADLLEEYGGYCISGDPCWLQKALFLIGEGANGKSVYMEVLGALAGKEAHSAVPFQDLEKDTYRYRLVNKLFNYSEETSVNALHDSSMFKTLVSGGAMQVKQLYVQPYDVENRAKLIMASNDMPRNVDMSYGFFRRLLLVEFKRQFTADVEGYDPYLKDKLMAELPGICNRLMSKYEKVRERGGFSAQQAVQKRVEALRRDIDTVQMFVDEHVEKLEVTSSEYTKSSELYEHYRQMCEVKGFRPHNQTHFARNLYRIDRDFEERKVRSTINGGKTFIYAGIKLNKEF